MDVVKAVETYVTKLIATPSTMKVLLLDSHTTPIVSLAATQSTLLSHQVYLTDRIDNKKRDRMPHMKCVCFLQNNEDSLAALEAELSEPKYGEYYLYFSNILSKTAIERLAEVDEYEVVKEVQEYFADYAPLLPCLFSLNHTPTSSKPLYGSTPNTWDSKALEHAVQGLTAVLLSLKKKPIIRYEKMSGMAKKLAVEVQEILLTTNTDPFFQAHYLATFGDLGSSLKNYVQSYQSRSMAHSPSAINSISDMKKFVEEYPEFRKLGGNVSKHVALVGELSRIVGRDKLLEIGEVEQGLATSAGTDQRQDDLFSTESLLAKGRSALKGLKGVENVYTQHTPHLSQTLEHLFRGRLKETSYPFVEPPGMNAGLQRPQDVIIFMIGGTTYEEARTVSLFNQDPAAASNGVQAAAGTRLLLGGTCVHNSSSYLEMIRSAATSFPSSVYEPPPESASNAPALNLNLGGVNVSLGGPGGSGVFRSSGEGVSVQADGIRDGVLSLFDKVKQGVDRIATQ
ncbi:hypothetical protein C0991_004486 [Blastosporella zonata]|nr:hypothetical protein C0991_004486 [Blastosporella zonata]